MRASDPATRLLRTDDLPATIHSSEALDDLLCRPTQALIYDLTRIDGDVMILGVGGKMGLTVAGLARAALPANRRVIGVARFSDATSRTRLEARGVETIAADLMEPDALAALPDVKNIVFMAGHKFGASSDPSLTWAMNVLLPARVAERFARSRIVAFSTGCVYPFADVTGQGSSESTPPDPPGEYAQSCVGRERMFEYSSRKLGTPGKLFRLNYAIDLRYGVLHDIAQKIAAGKPIDVTMGHVNIIWQGDASIMALRCLAHCTSPTTPINVSGETILRVRELAEMLGEAMGVAPVITGTEASHAWITDTSAATELFAKPIVDLGRMIKWQADWVQRGGASLGKPTKFEVRDGRY